MSLLLTSLTFLQENRQTSKFGQEKMVAIAFFVSRCKDGYVKIYINGQEEEHHYDQHDYMFCGE